MWRINIFIRTTIRPALLHLQPHFLALIHLHDSGLSKYIFSAPASHTTVEACEGLNARAICERSAALGGRKRGACGPAITDPTNPRPQFGNKSAPLVAAAETAETGVHVERPPVAPPVAERAEAFHLF